MIGAQAQLTNDMIIADGGAQSPTLVQYLKNALDDVTRGSAPSNLLMESAWRCNIPKVAT